LAQLNFHHVVMDGSLKRERIAQSTTINKQKNANKKYLERFSLKNAPDGQNYIFKPTHTSSEIKQEQWIQEQFLPLLPGIKTPRLLDWDINEQAQLFWMVLEDAGQLTHEYTENLLIEAAKAMVCWHNLPLETEIRQSTSFLPYIDEVAAKIVANEVLYTKLLHRLRIDSRRIQLFFEKLHSLTPLFPSENVISHGDYHILNLALNNDQLIVLDWEFLQRNSVYFDLFLLIDRADIRYRIHPTKAIRLIALETYGRERTRSGWVMPNNFVHNYHLFACIYSTLTLEWLFNDLDTGKFDRALLLAEKTELTNIINDCLEYIEVN
jgi:thiamine kinase-like enzyme